MILVVEAFDGCVLDGPVHPFDLAVGPRVLRLGGAVIDAGLGTGILEGVRPDGLSPGEGFDDQRNCRAARAWRRELDAVVGQHGVDPVGHGFEEMAEKVSRDARGRFFVQLDEGKLRRAVDGDEQVKLAGLRPDLGDIDVEIAERVSLELAFAWGGALELGQSGDAVTLQTAVQAGAGQVRDGRLQRVEAVVERQQGVPPEGHDDRLVLQAEHAGTGLLRPHARIGAVLARAPLLDRGRADAVALGGRPYAHWSTIGRRTRASAWRSVRQPEHLS